MIRELPKAKSRKERRWEVVVYAGLDPMAAPPEDPTKRKRETKISRVFYGTKQAAQDFEAELVTEMNRGNLGKSSSTFGDLLERWMIHIEARGRSPWTLRGYRSSIERAIKPSLGHIQLSKLRSLHLDTFYETQLAKGLSPRTVRQFHAIISAAIRQGSKWDVIDEDVSRHATAPTVHPEQVSTATPEDIRALITAAEAKNRVLATFIVLAAVSGARRGELCALRWGDVDLEVGALHIRRSIYDGGGGVVEKDTKTHQERVVSLDELAVEVLERHWTAEQTRRSPIAPTADDPYVFSPDPNGLECYRPSSVTHFFGDLREDLKLKRIRLHDLRHFSVSRALNAGIDPLAVSKRHGHRSTRMTLEVYGHALPATDLQAAAITGSLVLGKLPAAQES